MVPNCLSLASREVAPSRLGDRPSRQPLFLRPRLCRMHACSLCSTQPRDNHMWVPTRSEQPKHAMRVRLSQSCPTGTSSLVCSSVSFFDRSHFIHSFSTACAPVNNGRLLFSNYTNTLTRQNKTTLESNGCVLMQHARVETSRTLLLRSCKHGVPQNDAQSGGQPSLPLEMSPCAWVSTENPSRGEPLEISQLHPWLLNLMHTTAGVSLLRLLAYAAN